MFDRVQSFSAAHLSDNFVFRCSPASCSLAVSGFTHIIIPPCYDGCSGVRCVVLHSAGASVLLAEPYSGLIFPGIVSFPCPTPAPIMPSRSTMNLLASLCRQSPALLVDVYLSQTMPSFSVLQRHGHRAGRKEKWSNVKSYLYVHD